MLEDKKLEDATKTRNSTKIHHEIDGFDVFPDKKEEISSALTDC